MNIFVSWSGEKSRRVAIGLKELIQQIDKRNIAWFSDRDMLAGGQWQNELMSRLRDSHFGILCITRESLQSSWLLFEAGALGAGVSEGKVCPFLIDVDRNDLSEPLGLFQSKNSSKEQTRDLLQSINFAMKDNALSENTLIHNFETFWPSFELLLQEINREFIPLPVELRQQMLDTLSDAFNFDEIKNVAFNSGIPFRLINWNQALYYVIDDILQVAVDELKLGTLIKEVSYERPNHLDIQEVVQKFHEWENATN